EGNPIQKFIDLVIDIQPAQVTLVPDAIDAITSNAGWDTINNQSFLQEIVSEFQRNNIRTSIFMDTNLSLIEAAAKTGTDRIELYTEAYAVAYAKGNKMGINPYVEAAKVANSFGLGLNAGHDLSLDNLQFFVKEIPSILEVSIGHALISEALYFGLENVVNMYLQKLK
ncbi:MAG: pyridoxine 5'-phosphate synthase, partial [Flavobacteriaceae bacterium]|nr:pyridoxine 5'-phosphate synthase [Flavobacteriaceae bacterium]